MTFVEITRVWVSGRPRTTVDKYINLIEDLDFRAQKMFEVPLLALKTPQVNGLLRSISSTVSARTQANRLWILKGFYRCAIELGARRDNPAKPLRPPKYENTLAERLIKHDQVVAIIAQATSENDRMLMQLMYYAGLRVSEVIHLSGKDILGDGRIKVFGKGEKTEYVRVHPDFERKLLAFSPKAGFLFPDPRNVHRPIRRRHAWAVVREAGIKAGIPKVSPHWFRHAHATEALRRGASLPLVQASLRHASVLTTMQYSHVLDGDGASLYLPTPE